MLRKNDEITVEIERLAGDMGIAHLEGMTLFVQGALPGETVIARAQKVEKTHAFLKTLRVLSPSPDRAEPPCPYYAQCGGCACQHMTYELSLQMKRERIRDALSRIGGLEIDVPPVLGMAEPWHYRNKTALPVGGEKGAPRIGFYAPRSHRIVEIGRCLIARQESNEVTAAVRLWMEKFQVPPYDETTRRGSIRHVMSRVSRKGEVMAVIVAAAGQLPHERELTALLRSTVPGLVSVYLNINMRGDNVILGKESRLLFGAERLEDTLCGLKFALSPQSFFQVNPVQTEKLYQTALDFAGLRGDELVCDLYCGAGTISLLLARHARQVIGVEVVPQAVRDAEENARANGVENARFYAGETERILPGLVAQGLRPDVAVLDPPRRGCEEAVLRALIEAAPRRIVYVSCDPATLARDAKLLCAGGYRAEKCQGVDLFCQTNHVETVVLLSHKKPDTTISVKVEVGEGEGKVPLDKIAKRAENYKPKERVTYKMIKEYIEAKYGFKVHMAYIAEVKRDLGLPMYDAPNAVEELKQPRKHPTVEKVEAIKGALKYFKII